MAIETDPVRWVKPAHLSPIEMGCRAEFVGPDFQPAPADYNRKFVCILHLFFQKNNEMILEYSFYFIFGNNLSLFTVSAIEAGIAIGERVGDRVGSRREWYRRSTLAIGDRRARRLFPLCRENKKLIFLGDRPFISLEKIHNCRVGQIKWSFVGNMFTEM